MIWNAEAASQQFLNIISYPVNLVPTSHTKLRPSNPPGMLSYDYICIPMYSTSGNPIPLNHSHGTLYRTRFREDLGMDNQVTDGLNGSIERE